MYDAAFGPADPNRRWKMELWEKDPEIDPTNIDVLMGWEEPLGLRS